MLNEDIFENIDTEAKAYWLGWMLSDGFITERQGNRQPTIGLKVKPSDIVIIQKFKIFLGTSNIITIRDNYVSIRVHSRKMANDLAKYTVTPRKSSKTRLPILSNKLMPHLIRGFLDGDGWITKTYPKQYNGKCKYSIGFCSPSLIVNDIMNFLNKELDLPLLKTSKTTWKGNPFYQLEYQGKKDCIKLFHYMYDEATIYLERKYLKMHGDSEVNNYITKG